MSSINPADNFLPGDRVFNHNDHLATVIERRFNEPAHSVSLHVDNLPSANNYASSYATSLKRQPIQAGCHARYNTAGWTNYIGKVASVDTNKWATFENGACSLLAAIVRVADPKPATVFVNVTGYDSFAQIQRFAHALARKHFGGKMTVADTLPEVLSQIDHMTAQMAPRVATTLTQDAINRLAEFIQAEVPGEPSRNEGAVDTAIRVMRRQEEALVSVCKILRDHQRKNWLPAGSVAWLKEYDARTVPPAAPTFNRGDLVTWGAGGWIGRIVGPAPSKTAPWEVIITAAANGGFYSDMPGKFVTPALDTLRYVDEPVK